MLAIYYRDLFELLNIRLQCKSYNFRICGALNYFNNFSFNACLQNETED